jgi:hypothetical protein
MPPPWLLGPVSFRWSASCEHRVGGVAVVASAGVGINLGRGHKPVQAGPDDVDAAVGTNRQAGLVTDEDAAVLAPRVEHGRVAVASGSADPRPQTGVGEVLADPVGDGHVGVFGAGAASRRRQHLPAAPAGPQHMPEPVGRSGPGVLIPGNRQRPLGAVVGPREPLGARRAIDGPAGRPAPAAVGRDDLVHVGVGAGTGVAGVVAGRLRALLKQGKQTLVVASGFGLPRSANTTASSLPWAGLTEMLP